MTNQHQSSDSGESTQPPASTGGGYTNPDQHSFLLQCTLDMKASVGGLESAVNNLNETVKSQVVKVDKIQGKITFWSGVIAAAAFFLSLTIGVGIYVFDKALDYILEQSSYTLQENSPEKIIKKKEEGR